MLSLGDGKRGLKGPLGERRIGGIEPHQDFTTEAVSAWSWFQQLAARCRLPSGSFFAVLLVPSL
jgi:hypothetical protein